MPGTRTQPHLHSNNLAGAGALGADWAILRCSGEGGKPVGVLRPLGSSKPPHSGHWLAEAGVFWPLYDQRFQRAPSWPSYKKCGAAGPQCSLVQPSSRSALATPASTVGPLAAAPAAAAPAPSASSLPDAAALLVLARRTSVAYTECTVAVVMAKVREVLDKSKALQARYGRQLAERVELVKKGSTMGEISRKLAPGQEALEAARRELKNAIDTVFGAY